MPVQLVRGERHGEGRKRSPAPDQGSGAGLHIGLVNNMPDTALEATERQFVSLLSAASESISVRLSLYTLPSVSRGAGAATYLAERYLSVEELWGRSLDGLIVTGAEPIMANLIEEPYWQTLSATVAWARENTYSTMWSCLAAHAAVLTMDGIDRVRRAEKHFGIFESVKLGAHPLLEEVSSRFKVPHSRWNGVAEVDLQEAGYTVLSRTGERDVDVFIKQEKSLFVFMQGHPEYEADTLLREYRRDLLRSLQGETEVPARLPRGYFDGRTEVELTRAFDRAGASRSEGSLREILAILQSAEIRNTWTSTATCVYRNWLGQMLLRKAKADRSRIVAGRENAQSQAFVDRDQLAKQNDRV